MKPALIVWAVSLLPLAAQPHEIAIQFAGAVNGQPFECGQTYAGVGAGRSSITPQDFRFYVHDLRLVDAAGDEHLLVLEQRTKWQIERVVLLDFENREGGCSNGSAETNLVALGTIDSAGPWTALRFTLGVPFNRNHTDLSRMPPPLNLTALAWSWNAGRKFARIEVANAESAGGFTIHLGSTGCMPTGSGAHSTPTSCSAPNRAAVELAGFDPDVDVVVADLGALLASTDVARNTPQTPEGCRSGPEDADCAGLFQVLGLPFGGEAAGEQSFFRIGPAKGGAAAAE